MHGNGDGSSAAGPNGDRTTVAGEEHPFSRTRTQMAAGAVAFAIAIVAGGAGYVVGQDHGQSTSSGVTVVAPTTTAHAPAGADCHTPNQGLRPVVGRVSAVGPNVISLGGNSGPTLRIIVSNTTRVCRMQPATIAAIATGDAVAVQGTLRPGGLIDARQITLIPRGLEGRRR
jgi:hypothetical protein